MRAAVREEQNQLCRLHSRADFKWRRDCGLPQKRVTAVGYYCNQTHASREIGGVQEQGGSHVGLKKRASVRGENWEDGFWYGLGVNLSCVHRRERDEMSRSTVQHASHKCETGSLDKEVCCRPKIN